MKQKVVYFLLGAFVATLAYMAGENSKASDQIMEVQYIRVTKGILIGGKEAELKTAIGPGVVAVSKGDKKAVLTINTKGTPIVGAETPEMHAFIGIEGTVPFVNLKNKVTTKTITPDN